MEILRMKTMDGTISCFCMLHVLYENTFISRRQKRTFFVRNETSVRVHFCGIEEFSQATLQRRPDGRRHSAAQLTALGLPRLFLLPEHRKVGVCLMYTEINEKLSASV